jgi:hypothetical protein
MGAGLGAFTRYWVLKRSGLVRDINRDWMTPR